MMRENDTAPVRLLDVAVALVLLTRLPLPPLPVRAFDRQARATWAYPLAGLAVGALSAAAAALALSLGLDPTLAAGLALGTQALVTGAMHEDGLADMADGVWGGQTPQRRLEIMADSRIGTYGVLALAFSVGLRWAALASVLAVSGPWVLIGLAALSRAGLPGVMAALPHARPGGLSASVGTPPGLSAGLAILLGLVLAVLTCGAAAGALLVTMGLASVGIAALARARIGGQTGDVLGATQQVCEIAGLLVLAALI